MITASIFVKAFYLYLAIGLLFSLWFVSSGVQKIDEGMQHAPLGMRLLLMPGSILLWPVLLRKYLAISK